MTTRTIIILVYLAINVILTAIDVVINTPRDNDRGTWGRLILNVLAALPILVAAICVVVYGEFKKWWKNEKGKQ